MPGPKDFKTSKSIKDLLQELSDDEETNHTNGLTLSSHLNDSVISRLGVGVGVGAPGDDGVDKPPQQTMKNIEQTVKMTRIVALLVIIMGAAAGSGFLYLGISNAQNEQQDNFERRSSDLAKEIESAWRDYEQATLWIHQTCRDWRKNNMTRKDFRVLYNYLASGGLEFFAMEWVPNVTHAERAALEAQAYIDWDWYKPEGPPYRGFTGLEQDPNSTTPKLLFQKRSPQDWYYPMHFMEPSRNQGAKGHMDLVTLPHVKPAILKAVNTMQPALTTPFILVHETKAVGNSVVLFHPGVELPDDINGENRGNEVSNMVIKVHDLLVRSSRFQGESLAVYLYDFTGTEASNGEDPPLILGGIEIRGGMGNMDGGLRSGVKSKLNFPDDTPYEDLELYTDKNELVFEQTFPVASRIWRIVVLPIDDSYDPDLRFIILSGSMIFVASLLLSGWMLYKLRQQILMHQVVTKAAAEAAIVSNLFPANVRHRMLQDAAAARNTKGASKDLREAFLNAGPTKTSPDFDLTEKLHSYLSSEGIFGSKPIAELHPYTTVMFADLVGFTAWSSVREPSQVFQLLEIIYHSFDTIAKRRRVFKVETVGDCYVAVSGLPEPRKDHAVVIAKFAHDCVNRMNRLAKALETTLGPDTGDLAIRVGVHSGQVTAGVLRGDKGRFQLFGDTMNTAARLESTSLRNRIQLSQETADLITDAGYGRWLVPREDKVIMKGKGSQKTYFLKIVSGSHASKITREQALLDNVVTELGRNTAPVYAECSESKKDRLIDWTVEVLSGLLRRMVARREATGKRAKSYTCPTLGPGKGEMVLHEVQEIISLPAFNESALRKQVDPDLIKIDPEVISQLSKLITTYANMYRKNPFHNFEHVSHVTMSVLKMMTRIVDPKEIAVKKKLGGYDDKALQAELHDHTFGITSDPLTQFACAFSALIHDLDHEGVPNTTLVKERSPLAVKYKNKSVAEQNSVDLAWKILMRSEYDKLRMCICCDSEEFARFRSLVVNSVMATDIMDKELGTARKQRWNIAFSGEEEKKNDSSHDPLRGKESQESINRKATIVIEHLIQASDISHTMQHWHVYVKWNERLFHEMYRAYKAGRLDKDPSENWYKGEIGFFDFYIIPLAKKLFTCGVFGVSSDEFLNYALTNRKEWEQKGAQMVKQYLASYHEEEPSNSSR